MGLDAVDDTICSRFLHAGWDVLLHWRRIMKSKGFHYFGQQRRSQRSCKEPRRQRVQVVCKYTGSTCIGTREMTQDMGSCKVVCTRFRPSNDKSWLFIFLILFVYLTIELAEIRPDPGLTEWKLIRENFVRDCHGLTGVGQTLISSNNN